MEEPSKASTSQLLISSARWQKKRAARAGSWMRSCSTSSGRNTCSSPADCQSQPTSEQSKTNIWVVLLQFPYLALTANEGPRGGIKEREEPHQRAAAQQPHRITLHLRRELPRPNAVQIAVCLCTLKKMSIFKTNHRQQWHSPRSRSPPRRPAVWL